MDRIVRGLLDLYEIRDKSQPECEVLKEAANYIARLEIQNQLLRYSNQRNLHDKNQELD